MTRAIALATCLAALPLGAFAASRAAPAPAPAHAPSAQGARYGIAPVSTRLASGGYMVYFRYRVTDAQKAQSLFHDGINPTIYDRASKQQLSMPRDTKLGGLRSSPRSHPEPGKVYYVLFANPAKTVHKGSHIDVAIGDCHLSDLVVE